MTPSNVLTGQTPPDPQQPQSQGFFASIGAGLKRVMPYVTPIANRLAAAAGNYGPLELEHQQAEFQLRKAHEDTQEQLAQSQLQNQELNRQLLTKQVANYESPEQQRTAAVEQAGKLEQQKNINAPPTDVVGLTDSGSYGHFNRTFNPQTKQWETKPTMVQGAVPNPELDKYAAPKTLEPEFVGPTLPPPPPTLPATIPQEHQLMSMPKASGAPLTEPTKLGSTTGYDHVWYQNGVEINRRPEALPPYAQQGQETSSTVEQTGPTGLHEVNTTTTRRTPVGGGASNPAAAPNRPAAPPARPIAPPRPTAFNVTGPEARNLMDQNTTLDATNQIIERIRASKQQFASMLDAGLITLAVDPKSHDLTVSLASRSLTPEQQKVAGDWQSLAEHINILRQPLGGTGFRSEEAWQALQAQRGRLMQAPGVLDQTLSNTQQILRGLRSNNRRLLGPMDNPPPAAAATGSFVHF